MNLLASWLCGAVGVMALALSSGAFAGVSASERNAVVVNAALGAVSVDSQGRYVLVGGDDASLLRSVDAGQHWQQVDVPGVARISDFVQGEHGTVLALSDGQLLRSIDQGLTWTTQVSPAGWHFMQSYYDAGRQQWFAVTGEGAVMNSRDDGVSWGVLAQLPGRPVLAALSGLAGGRMVIAGYGGLLWQSSADLRKWTPVTTRSAQPIARFQRLPHKAGVLALWADGVVTGVSADGRKVWHGAAAEDVYLSAATIDDRQGYVYVGNADGYVARSRDNGRSWRRALIAERAYISALQVDRDSGDVMAFGARAIVAKSGDHGATWTTLTPVDWSSRINAVGIMPGGRRLIAVGTGGMMLVSDDRGDRWSSLRPNAGRFVREIIRVGGSERLVGVGEFGLLVSSDDRGASWQVHHPDIRTEVDLFSIVREAQSGNLLASGAMGTVLLSRDGGAHWQGVQPVAEAGEGFFGQLVVAAQGGVVLAVSPERIMRSADGGVTWARLGAEALGGAVQSAAAVSATAFVAVRKDGQIMHSEDGGLTWQASEHAVVEPSSQVWFEPANQELFILEKRVLKASLDGGLTWQSHALPEAATINFVFRTAQAHTLIAVGNDGFIARSADDGAHWQAVASGTQSALRKPVVSMTTGRIYVPGRDGTVLYSKDDGRSWLALESHTVGHLSRAVLDANEQRLIAAGERIVRIDLPE